MTDATNENQAPVQPATTRGRPKQHADNAARQRAYRQRKKAEGQREVKRWVSDVRDINTPLTSTIIDLSAVKNR